MNTFIDDAIVQYNYSATTKLNDIFEKIWYNFINWRLGFKKL